MRASTVLVIVTGWAICSLTTLAEKPPAVRPEHPRIFLRAKSWDGPSVEKIKSWMNLPEYRAKTEKVRAKLVEEGPKNTKLLILYMFADDQEAGREVLNRFMNQRTSGHTPSYWGIVDQTMAMTYDWLYHPPDPTEAPKKNRRDYLALRCQANIDYLKNTKENPFYSRFAGCLGGLTACALAIADEHPNGREYLEFAYNCLREKMGTIREAEDGASGGGSYAYMHEFTDLANAVACWRSATDWDAAKWIKDHQGNWLERQMLYQIWMTYPNGRFVKDGDTWGLDTADEQQYRMSLDVITSMYRNGFGRTHADAIYKRYGLLDYHHIYIWEWFVFNDPEVPAKPLDGLGRAEVFSPNLHGMVCWRSGWDEDATIIHFRAGESPDTHGTEDQGKFIIFKLRPLAIKNGDYLGWMTPVHRYYRSPWSANSLVFTRKGGNWEESTIKFPKFAAISHPDWPSGLFSWAEWKALREKATSGPKPWARPPMGKLVLHEANEKYARAVADLNYYRRPPTAGQKPEADWFWTRELVFLDYKYLIVLDRVKPDVAIEHRWTLHTTFEPTVDGPLAVADNGPARLFCRTLLPEKPVIKKVGGPGSECDWNGKNCLPEGWNSIVKTPDGQLAYTTFDKEKQEPVVHVLGPKSQMGAWRLDVSPEKPDSECLYLHVLFPTDTTTEKMPDCSVVREKNRIKVRIGSLEHLFECPKEDE
ncbi:MAG: hypothetical protein N2255_09150 [Kiritimatiellae bacterium]|nr:hypothetical protein [Kiritimatiellia bacterium]